MGLSVEELCRAVKTDDKSFDTFITEKLSLKDTTEAATWKLKNYYLLRQISYPPISDYLDAQVKLLLGDSKLVAEGQDQLDKWVQDCLAVKARFSKPTDEVTKEDE